jgi:hypothetical protein
MTGDQESPITTPKTEGKSLTIKMIEEILLKKGLEELPGLDQLERVPGEILVGYVNGDEVHAQLSLGLHAVEIVQEKKDGEFSRMTEKEIRNTSLVEPLKRLWRVNQNTLRNVTILRIYMKACNSVAQSRVETHHEV